MSLARRMAVLLGHVAGSCHLGGVRPCNRCPQNSSLSHARSATKAAGGGSVARSSALKCMRLWWEYGRAQACTFVSRWSDHLSSVDASKTILAGSANYQATDWAGVSGGGSLDL